MELAWELGSSLVRQRIKPFYFESLGLIIICAAQANNPKRFVLALQSEPSFPSLTDSLRHFIKHLLRPFAPHSLSLSHTKPCFEGTGNPQESLYQITFSDANASIDTLFLLCSTDQFCKFRVVVDLGRFRGRFQLRHVNFHLI